MTHEEDMFDAHVEAEDRMAAWDQGAPVGYIAVAMTPDGYPARGALGSVSPGITSYNRETVERYIAKHQDSPVGRSLRLCEIRLVEDA